MDYNTPLHPSIVVTFGGSGDLNNRKLIPAYYNLYLDGQMPEKFAIIGLGRTEFSDAKFRNTVKEGVNEFSRSGKVKEEVWNTFAENICYLKSDVFKEDDYKTLEKKIHSIEKEWGIRPNVIFYLAISPKLIETVATNLSKLAITKDTDATRIVVEKPFGHDLASAQKLNELLTGIFDEKQIYRIDHYLGKEAVQNMLVFRFGNVMFEPIWNRKYIEHVQITVSESVDVGDRGGYYDTSGALKDMIQNHVLQLLCFVAMEPPVSFSADEIRSRKVDVLRAIRKYSTPKEVFENTARGQYSNGWAKGKSIPGYRQLDKVDKRSNTETYAAVKFLIDNWRWQDVPFYVRSGKTMPEKTSVITVQFRPVPHNIFPSSIAGNLSPNRIIISISPATGIRIRFQAKQVGLNMRLGPEELIFNYSDAYDTPQPEAYETLLHDVLSGDPTLFMRSDEVEAAWAAVMPIINAWQNTVAEFPNYEAGTWGPEAAERLIAKDGFHWITKPIK